MLYKYQGPGIFKAMQTFCVFTMQNDGEQKNACLKKMFTIAIVQIAFCKRTIKASRP